MVFVDLTQEHDPPEFSGDEGEPPGEPEPGLPPVRRVRQKTGTYEFAREHGDSQPLPDPPAAAAGNASSGLPMEIEDEIPAGAEPLEIENEDNGMDLEGTISGSQENKRELDAAPEPPGKRSRLEFLEAYNLQLQALMKQRQRKESSVKDCKGKDAARLQRAIQKEIRNNLETGAYRLLTLSESEKILQNKREKGHELALRVDQKAFGTF